MTKPISDKTRYFKLAYPLHERFPTAWNFCL